MGGTAPAVSSTFVPIRVLWLIKGLGPGGAETLLAAAARAHDHEAFHIECAYVLPYKDHLAEQLEQAGVRCHCLSTKRSDLGGHPAAPPDRRRRVRHRPQPLSPAGGSRQDRRADAARREAPEARDDRAQRVGHVRRTHPLGDAHDSPARRRRVRRERGDQAQHARSCRRAMHDVQHGIDVAGTAALAAERDAVRKELGIGDDELVIGTVANYREQKDYPNLLRAAAELDERGVSARVVAVGQGQLEADIVALRDDLGLQERVMLTGYRPDATTRDGSVRRVHAGLEVRGPPRRPDGGAGPRSAHRGHTGGRHRRDVDRRRSRARTPQDPIALCDGWVKVIESPELRERLAARRGLEAGRRLRRPTAVTSTRPATGVCAHRPAEEPADAPKPVLEGPLPESRSGRQPTDDRPAILALLTKSLGWHDDPRYQALFEWKHDQNPFGPSPMWVATDGDRVVGLRVFMRWQFRRGGRRCVPSGRSTRPRIPTTRARDCSRR
jgi:L-malate glycosyltransferase